jgi:MSHA pilin protein MshC
MVELIVVIILIGILGAIGAARFFDRSGFDTAAFSTQAAAALRFAQKTAIAQNRPVTVLLNADSIALCYSSSSPCPGGQQVTAPFSISTDGSICTSAGWYCLRRPSAVNYSANTGIPSSISFDALGRPSSGGTHTTSVVNLSFTEGASSNQVNVEPETGYVH